MSRFVARVFFLNRLSQIGRWCLLLQVVFAITFGFLDWQNLPAIFTTSISVLTLTLIPGVLVLGSIGVNLQRPQAWLYVVSASLTSLMLLGAAASALHISNNHLLPPPLTTEYFPWFLLVFTGTLTLIHELSGKRSQLPASDQLSIYRSREFLLAVVLVYLAATGAVFLERFNTNAVLLFTLAVCIISPIFLLRQNLSSARRVALLWGVTLALLFQKSLLRTRLAGGDVSDEIHYSQISLAAGHWVPQIPSARTTSLRLTILHPIYTLMTDLSIIWEYKILYPVLFSLTAVAIYYLAADQFNPRIGVTAVMVYVFSHPFFTLLSLNSRTGQALFFTVIFALAAVDDRLDPTARSVSMLFAFLGALFSHYAVAPLLMFMLGSAWLIRLVLTPLDDTRPAPTSSALLGLVGVFLIGWYTYVADGHMIKSLVTIASNAILGLLQPGSSFGEAGANSVSLQLPSLTYQFIRYEYIVILALSCIGLLFAVLGSNFLQEIFSRTQLEFPSWIQRLTSEFQDVHPWFLALGIGAAAIAPMSFLPGISFGVARIYMIVMVFLAGFSMAALHQISGTRLNPSSIAVACLAIMLIFNTGFLAATVTHDPSPQPNLIRNHIIDEGSNEFKFHLWRRWTPASDKGQSKWIADYAAENLELYRGKISRVPFDPPPETDRVGGGPMGTLMRKGPMCNGYIYLTTLDYSVGEVITDSNPDFIYYDKSVPLHHIRSTTSQSPKIYDAGENTIYHKQC